MTSTQIFEPVSVDALLDRVRQMRQEGFRLVQIGATRLPEQIELTYSFDLECNLANLRIHLPAEGARVPSISSIYWCAFLYENEIHDLFNVQVDGIAVDFQGNLYQTTVKFPFGCTNAPVVPAKPAPAKANSATAAAPAQPAVSTTAKS
jgi:ech hydrogenase subunit D